MRWTISVGLAALADMIIALGAMGQSVESTAEAPLNPEIQFASNHGRDHNRDYWDDRINHRGPRYDRWDWRNNSSWGNPSWRWNRPAYVWGPPRRVYVPRYYYYRHPDPWDVIVWGVLPIVIYEALSENARQDHQYAYSQAMKAPVGETIVWNDASSDGRIKTTRDGYAGEKYCREFEQTITIEGKQQDAWGVACQEPDGSWRLVPQD